MRGSGLIVFASAMQHDLLALSRDLDLMSNADLVPQGVSCIRFDEFRRRNTMTSESCRIKGIAKMPKTVILTCRDR